MPDHARCLGRAATAAALAALALTAAGCDDEKPAHAPAAKRNSPATPKAGSTRARAEDVATIRAWSDTLSRGHVAAAARYFAVPVVVENGSPPLSLNTPPTVKVFNSLLPCGAKLLHAHRVGRYTVATFRLSERPGGRCGAGTGEKAATAFRFRHGKISEWRRVALPGEVEPAPEVGGPPPQKS